MSDEQQNLKNAREAANNLADFIETQIQLAASQNGLSFSAGNRGSQEDDQDYRSLVEVQFECSFGNLKADIYCGEMVGHNYGDCFSKAHIKISHSTDPYFSRILMIDEVGFGLGKEHFGQELNTVIEDSRAKELAKETAPATIVSVELTESEITLLVHYRRARGLTSIEEAMRVILAENISDTPSAMHERAREQVMRGLKKDRGNTPA